MEVASFSLQSYLYRIHIPTVRGNSSAHEFIVQKNYDPNPAKDEEFQGSTNDLYIWQALRATSAALRYFLPFGDYVDGKFSV